MTIRFLRCLARAAVENAGKLLNIIPGAEFAYSVAYACWNMYQNEQQLDQLRSDIEQVAGASPQQIEQDVQQAIQAEASGESAEVKQALAAYLTQVPAMTRHSLRRPSDPSGKSMPATLSLGQPADLVPFLPPRPPRFKAGERPLHGLDWELVELLGIGGFGEVWKARHPHMKSKAPVALKFCLEESAAKTLWNEAGVLDRIMQQGKHPGIVPLQMVYLKADPPCLEYEFVEGGDLTGLIQEYHEKSKLTTSLATRMIGQLAKTVAFFHQMKPPVVHCDLKPANILVHRNAKGQLILRIADFGIGGVMASQSLQQTKSSSATRHQMLTEAVRGAYTPLYASSQQMQRQPGDLPDPRDDVHALGIIWYQLVTGDLAMVAVPTDWREELQERGLSDPLIELLASCIASREEKRPANAQVLVDEITRLTPAKAVPADQVTATPVSGVPAVPLMAKPAAPRTANKPLPVARTASAPAAYGAATPRPVSNKGITVDQPRPGSMLSLMYILTVPAGIVAIILGIVLMVNSVRSRVVAVPPSEFQYYAKWRTEYRTDHTMMATGQVLLFGGIALEVVAFIIFLVWLYMAWSVLPEKYQDPSPGTAVGLLFIPLFNLYWIFRVVPGLSTQLSKALGDIDPSRRRHEAGHGVGLFACILCCIPYVNLLAPLLFCAWIALANSAKNRLIKATNSIQFVRPVRRQ